MELEINIEDILNKKRVEERNGIAIRPVRGVPEKELDKIQKEILGYNNIMRERRNMNLSINKAK